MESRSHGRVVSGAAAKQQPVKGQAVCPATPSRALARPLTRVLPGGASSLGGGGWVSVPPRCVSMPSHVYAYLTLSSAVFRRPSWYLVRRFGRRHPKGRHGSLPGPTKRLFSSLVSDTVCSFSALSSALALSSNASY